ncbi:MAG: DNA primase [Desulfurococcales archaeon]|nr:DNA primase [Desulfurococcales archaeon]
MKEKSVKSSMKYLIVASLEVNGRVDEHDIIGAIFGQTEGLLGEEFNLEKLQSKDKIGRIRVEIKRQGTKTVGKIYIPSNLDRVETAILAAMLETVDRIGPFDARIKVEEIRDLRQEKIKKIIERAKELVAMLREQEPDLKAIVREIAGTEVPRPSKIKLIEYGPDRLPASPGIEKADTIIVVEGRADVVNLMRYGYDNVIALGGAREKIPKTIVDLSKKKKVIAFVDGDRGGEIILKTLLSQAKVDYVARAPKGMEVEQLTGKEIYEALSNMEPAEIVKKRLGIRGPEEVRAEEKPAPPPEEAKPVEAAAPAQTVAVEEAKPAEQAAAPASAPAPAEVPQPAAEAVQAPKPQVETGLVAQIPKSVLDTIKELRGTLEAVFFDAEWKPIKRVKVRDLYEEIKKLEPGTVYAIVFDGIITQRIMDAAAEKGVKVLIGSRIGSKIKARPSGIVTLAFSDLV